MLSGYHQLTAHWALVGNIGWQEWSEFGKTGPDAEVYDLDDVHPGS